MPRVLNRRGTFAHVVASASGRGTQPLSHGVPPRQVLDEMLGEHEDDYLIFDCPGQIEL